MHATNMVPDTIVIDIILYAYQSQCTNFPAKSVKIKIFDFWREIQMMRHFFLFLNSVREFLKGTAEMHLAKLLHHKSDFEVVPDIKETADKQMLPRMSWDLTSCPGLGTKSRQQTHNG